MPKNIVICCDGTGNEYGDRNSNVIRLYQTLIRDSKQQVVYYHPGVGTLGAKTALTRVGKVWTKVRGLAFGYGLSENIADAYRFLMQTFEPGDRLFLFGFSRGAYTARALCGLLRMFGLLSPGNEGLIPYALRLFKRSDSSLFTPIRPRKNKFETAAGFKHTFSRECRPHFLGLWDTVSSVGWILDPIGLKPGRLPFTFDLDQVSIVRHAISIDERRAFFRQNLVHEEPGRDIKQVWFPGVHSDVGGSYPEAESGLAKIALRWMLGEAVNADLLIDDAVADRILGADPAFVKPLANTMMHKSLTAAWWLGEFWPKWTKKRVSPPGVEPPKFIGAPRLNLFRPRFIAEGARLHESLFIRKKLVPEYVPANLPKAYTVEPELYPAAYRARLEPGEEITIGVHAGIEWNDTALELRKGETYRFRASGRWFDASIPAGPAGYPSPNWYFRLLESRCRVPNANWFSLIGSIGKYTSAAFVIGDSVEKIVEESGVLFCFANDLPFLYRNNSGWVKVIVKRLA